VTPTDIVLLVASLFDTLGVPYVVVGSLASSARGVPRSTNDADIVADLDIARVGLLVRALSPAFYVDEAAVERAVNDGRSFNAIHLESGFKIDVFVPPAGGFGRQQLARRVRENAGSEAAPRELCIATAEDILLAKLQWYRAGGLVSDRQWRDVVGLMRVQGAGLDQAYLRAWAARLELTDLLERALAEADDAHGK